MALVALRNYVKHTAPSRESLHLSKQVRNLGFRPKWLRTPRLTCSLCSSWYAICILRKSSCGPRAQPSKDQCATQLLAARAIKRPRGYQWETPALHRPDFQDDKLGRACAAIVLPETYFPAALETPALWSPPYP